MDINQLTAWVAGCFEATGVIIVSPEVGPTGKPYAAITIEVILPPRSTAGERFIMAVNNGTVEGTAWRLGGYAAVRGFAQTLWPYLTPDTKRYINDELKRFKLKKAMVKNGGHNAGI